ncbi:fanconi anemia group M protein [Apiospora phragmitis]|uniref:Fanconi anemia group M protein n=1 Tax=Apiospora phragmitis TaxID=2905665 RepID=A0ABR1TSY9_9PEZI
MPTTLGTCQTPEAHFSTRENPKTKKATSHVYDESADEGDDCRRTSDLELTDESDDGSDLVGFVVDDGVQTSSVQPTSSMVQRSSSPTSPSTSSILGRNSKRALRAYEPALSATQESDIETDDDLPPLRHIAATQRQTQSSAQLHTDSGDTEDVLVQRARRGNRRAIVSDDEDDEDEDDDD